MEAGVFFDSIEEIDGCVVAGVGREAVERFGEYVVKDNCLRKRAIVDARSIGSAASCELSRVYAAAKRTVVSMSARGIYSTSTPQASWSLVTSVVSSPA